MKSVFLSAALLMTSVSANAESNGVIDTTALDLSMDPCNDFYQYACGSWLKTTKLPGDQGSWKRSFSVIYDQNLKTLKGVLEQYAAGKSDAKVPYAKKLGAYYSSCMNEKAIEQDASAALRGVTQQVEKLSDKKEIPALLARLHLDGVDAFFGFTSSVDLKDPTLNIAEIDQGGMGLSNPTQYTSTSATSESIRKLYQLHINKVFQLAGETPKQAQLDTDLVYNLELSLAQNALSSEEIQDPTETYHPTEMSDLVKQSPSFDFQAYINAFGIKSPKITNLTEPKFLTNVNTLIANSDLRTLKTYLKFRAIETISEQLGKGFRDEQFDFYSRKLNGQKEQSPRWKTCVNSVSRGMSEALGQAFVAKTFSPTAKQRVQTMIENLRLAFQQDLAGLDWLDDITRQAAINKLNLITQKIGYPEHFRKYDKLHVGKTYWQNALQARRFNSLRVLHKINGKVDPNEWAMSPQTVNAYYDPSVNNINFPAGILQPPFFSESADDASNYGAIGMVIGHEMTHGFDTTGSQFDGHGAVRDWWSPAVKTQFKKKAQCIIDQYNRFEALPGVFVNGALTITENIADHGGIKLGYNALKIALAGKAVKGSFGYTPEQEYFLAMAQNWCTLQTDESLRQRIGDDPHSPSKFRVNGPMSNTLEFARAFNCRAGAPMAPLNRCEVW